MDHALLQLSGITKAFGGVRALTRGELELHAGQVTALLGENGAGKSTLVKILTGVHQPDDGVIRIKGEPVRIRSPQDAQRLGISVIHQESVVFDDLTVAENIFVTHRPARRGLIAWRTMNGQATALLRQLESRIDPQATLSTLSVAEKHLVQIARALSEDAQIVVMDEPTAALSHHEAEELLRLIRRLRDEGRAILFISHRFEEIFAVADRYAAFRDGAAVGHGSIAETSRGDLIHLMIGRQVDASLARKATAPGESLLNIEHLSREPEFADISFDLRCGEILGVYGLVGAGRSELMHVLCGLTQPDSGRMLLAGKDFRVAHPDEAIAQGIAHVPEDRQSQGAILSRTIADNVTLPSLSTFARLGFVGKAKEHAVARSWIDKLQIRCAGPHAELTTLSGGNQQKVVLARWLQTKPRVLILDEPTKGIDVGSKAVVHQLIDGLAQEGLGIILVSSDLPEILGLADRILVMRRGRARGLFGRSDASAAAILQAATDA